MTTTTVDRFWAKVQKTDTCWLWTAATHDFGYGVIRIAGRLHLAHRLAYEWLVGPIAEGLVIDHLCRVPACVNPEHLEPVTQRVNVLRGAATVRSHCPAGHPFTPENRASNGPGKHRCRPCKRASDVLRSTA